jgi:hypothetical protein
VLPSREERRSTQTTAKMAQQTGKRLESLFHIESLETLARVHFDRSELKQAEALFQQALEKRARIWQK